ncbi:MAG: hypothetical protein MZV63_68025 [Marinilabiliales bacterium]|nr:hypothetical protein [Marinilabiliales bacterium]
MRRCAARASRCRWDSRRSLIKEIDGIKHEPVEALDGAGAGKFRREGY